MVKTVDNAAHGLGPPWRRFLVLLALAAALLAGSCARHVGTYDVSALEISRYRYLIDPKDELVRVVVEVHNAGPETVAEAVVVITGIGRNGEKRGESRSAIKKVAPGERRPLNIAFKNRARLATVEVSIEPVPQEEQGK